MSENNRADSKDTKSKLRLFSQLSKTFVYAIAIGKPSSNQLFSVPTTYGEPIGGYVVDDNDRCYYIKCAEKIPLGFIPVSFKMKMVGVDNWETRVPVPESVVYRYLNENQLRMLEDFKEKFSDHKFQFLQLVGK